MRNEVMGNYSAVVKFVADYRILIRTLGFTTIFTTVVVVSMQAYIPSPENLSLAGLLFICGLSCYLGPDIARLAVSPAWNLITPCSNRLTYIEDEIVFVFSAIIGPTFAFTLLSPVGVITSLRFSTIAIVMALPIIILCWAAIRRVYPIDHSDPDVERCVQSIAQDRKTNPFFRNVFAYTAAQASVVLFQTCTVYVVIVVMRPEILQSGPGLVLTILTVLFSCTGVSFLMAPFIVAAVGMIKQLKNASVGVKYMIGHSLILAVIFGLSLKNAMSNEVSPAILVAYTVAAAIIAAAYAFGAVILNAIYRDRSVI